LGHRLTPRIAQPERAEIQQLLRLQEFEHRLVVAMLRVVGVEPVHVHVVDGEDQVVPPAGFHDAAEQPHLSAAPLALDKGRGKYGDEEGGRFERLQSPFEKVGPP
jgi:hypothetical protein